ncbi:MAG: PAS domain S-box protein [Cyclobacteriaceae bacterium]
MFDQFEETEAAQFFQSVFNGADLVIFTLDKEYRYTFFNQKHAAVMKTIWNVEIDLGACMLDYIDSAEDKAKAKANFDKALEGEVFSCEEEYGDEKINRFYYEDKYSPIFDKNKTVIGLSVVVNDITFRRTAEVEKLKKEARFRQLFENSGDGVAMYNTDGNFLEVNTHFSELFGYSVDEFKTLNVANMRAKNPQSNQIGAYQLSQVLKNGRVVYENDLEKKDGTVFRAQIISSRLKIENETFVQCVIRDISSPYKQQQLLRKFENFFKFSSDLLTVASMEGYFVELNPKTTILLGYTLGELKSKPLIEFVHPDDREKTQNELNNYLQGHSETINFENRYKRRKGGFINLQWNATVDKDAGLIYAVARDVTQLRKQEKFAIDSNDLLLELSKKSNLVNIDFDDFIQLVVTKAARLFDVDFCSYWSYDQAQEGITCVYDNKNRHNDGIHFISKGSHPRYFNAINKEHIVSVSRVRDDSRTSEFNNDYFISFAVKSLIDVQILDDTNFKGIICFESLLFRSWTIEEQSVISSIANIVNQALANGKLKRTQQALLEEQEIFKKFANNLPARVSIKKPGDRHIFGNTRELASWGVTQEEYCASTAQKFVAPEQLEMINRNDLQVISEGETIFSQFVDTSLEKVFEEFKFKLSEDLVGSVIFDVTETFLKNQQLHQRENELKDAQKIAKLGHYVFDFEKGEWDSSEALNQIFGIEENFKRDRESWLSFIHEDFKNDIHDYFISGGVNKQKLFDEEYQIINQRTGEAVWVHGLGNLDEDGQGNVTRMIGTIQDITSRKKTEEEIYTLSLVASHTQHGVLIADSSGLIVWVNDAFTKMTGYSLPEVQGKKPAEFLFNSKSEKETIHKITQSLAEKRSVTVEVSSYRKDDSHYWNELKIDPIRGAKGEHQGFIFIQSDVTARYMAEQLLTASEEQLRRLVNSVPGAVMKYRQSSSGESEILYLSQGAEEIWEIPAYVLLNSIDNLWRMVVPDDIDAMVESIQYSAENLTLWDHTWRIKTKSGKLKWINARGKPYRDESGNTIWDTIHTDVTFINLAQNELSVSKQKYESLLNTIQGVVWEEDPETLGFNFVSEKAKEIFQFEVDEILKSNFWFSRLHPDDREASIAQYKLKIAQGLNHTYDYRFQRKDGKYIWIRDIVTLEKQGDKVVSIKGIMIDVTDQKQLELELAKSETLFKSFTDQLPALVYLKDEKKNYIFANSSKKALHNMLGESYLGLSAKDFLSEPKSSHLEQLDDWVLEQNRIAELSNWTYDDLDHRIFNEIKFPINLPDGTRLIGGIAMDVSESVALQEALLEEKTRAQNVIEATRIGTWIYDWSNDTLEINERWMEIIGYSKSDFELINLATWSDRLHPDDRAKVAEVFEAIEFEGNDTIDYDIRQKHKDGHWVWVRSRGSVLSRDIDGRRIKAAGTHLDITNEKLSTINLKKERAFARNVLASTEAGTWELDIASGITVINRRWAEIIGFSEEELFPISYDKFSALVHPDDLSSLERSYSTHLKGETLFHEVEFRQRHKKGHYVWVYTKGRVWERDEKGYPTKMGGTHLDIDKRKKAELEILRQQKNIENIIQSTRAGTWSINLSTKKMEINERFATMFGYTKADFGALNHGEDNNLSKLIHEDDLKLSRKLFKDHVEGKLSAYEAEFRVKHKAGHWVWILDRGRVIDRDEDGHPLNVYGIHLDITTRKNFQFELKKSEEKYKSLTENTSDIVALFDKEFNLEYISPSVKEVLGYDVDRYLEYNVLSRVFGEDRQVILDGFAEIESGSNEFTREYRMLKADEQLVWIQTRTKVIRDDHGQVLNILTSSNDISARKSAEHLLRETNDQLRSAVETASLGIWHANPFKKEYDWNHQVCEIFEISWDEFYINPDIWRDCLHEEDKLKTNAMLKKLWKGESVKEFRFRILTKSDTLKHILASGYPTVGDDGQLNSYIGVLIDVSSLVEQEEIAKQALADKNTLFKELHHRVKNNLQLVSSIIHLESRKLNNDVINNFVKETNSRLLSMAQIHEQLIKIEEVDQINISTYLDELVKDLVKSYSGKSKKYNLNLSILSTQMHIDKVLAIGLIVNETLSNAIKYAFTDEEEGEITIKLEQKDKGFHLSIADNGKGLPPGYESKQSLGIKLIYALVEQLDGVCSIENNNGVTYHIMF